MDKVHHLRLGVLKQMTFYYPSNDEKQIFLVTSTVTCSAIHRRIYHSV